jgi:hypothetical protein
MTSSSHDMKPFWGRLVCCKGMRHISFFLVYLPKRRAVSLVGAGTRCASQAYSAIGLLVFVGWILLPTVSQGTGGDVLWTDQYDLAGADDQATRIATQANRVFVGGSGQKRSFSDVDFVVRTYDANTGELLWDGTFPSGIGSSRAVSGHSPD